MFKERILHIIAFTLMALMLLKVSALHVYSHHDDNDTVENCEVCDAVIANQNVAFVASNAVTIKVPIEIPTHYEVLNGVTQNNSLKTIHFRLFGRPPPSIG